MAVETLQDDNTRAIRDAEFKRRLDDMVPVVTESIKRIQREDAWNEALARYKAACEAQDKADAECEEASNGDGITDLQNFVWEAVVAAKLTAENKLIETSAPDGAALVRKLELIVEASEEGSIVNTGWLQLALQDARRIFA